MTALAGTSARPTFDVPLFGNLTGRYYGYARPREIDAMLASPDPLGGAGCPPGDEPDEYLRPGPGAYYFFEAWQHAHGIDAPWALPPHPVTWTPAPRSTAAPTSPAGCGTARRPGRVRH